MLFDFLGELLFDFFIMFRCYSCDKVILSHIDIGGVIMRNKV